MILQWHDREARTHQLVNRLASVHSIFKQINLCEKKATAVKQTCVLLCEWNADKRDAERALFERART